MATTIQKVNSNLPNTDKISLLNDYILKNEGDISNAKFDVNEIQDIYNNLCLDRKFLRNQSIGNSLITVGGWSHTLAEVGYSIWSYTPTNYAYNSLNQLYFSGKVLSNEGEASSESATVYDKVYVYDDDSGGGFSDDTTNAGSPGGTEFTLMEDDGDYLYVGLATTYKGIKMEFKVRGSNYTNTMSYYNASSGDGWELLSEENDNLVDNTSNFESDGNITFDIPDDWITNVVNGQTKYWIRIETSTVPVTNAEAYYIIPANNVPGLLAMSSSEVQDEDWKWCSYSGSIYVTIRNAGNTAYEGDYYITSASSAANLQNFYIWNHVYSLDHQDSTWDPVIAKTSDYTATGDEGIILIDTTSENVVITLPTAVGIEGKNFIIKCIVLDSGRTASIDLESGQTIDDIGSYSFSNENDSVVLVSDGANYKRISYINLGAGSGDMEKATYNPTDDGIVELSKGIDDNAGNTATASDIKDAVTKKHTQGSDADLDATFEATFVKKVDTVNVLSDITSAGADIEDAVTKKHSQNTDTNTSSDTWKIGDGTDTTKVLYAQNGDGNEPGLRYNSATNAWQYANDGTTWTDIGAGGAPWRIIDIPAGAWGYPAADPAPLDTDVGTNLSILRHLMDDTTPEFIQRVIEMPHDLDASGSIYIYVYGYAVTADGNEIQLRLSYHGSDKGETWDVAYSTLDSGDYVTDAQQDELDEVVWNETVSNMSLSADDLVPIAISRIAIVGGTPLSDDWGLLHVRFKIARA